MPARSSPAGARRSAPRLSLRSRPRVYRAREIALGPGKAELLEAVARTGTLAKAAEELGMSYMRAWQLVQTMNRSFLRPLVLLQRGGPERGRADLTRAGRTALAAYRDMEAAGLRAMKPHWRRLKALLRP